MGKQRNSKQQSTNKRRKYYPKSDRKNTQGCKTGRESSDVSSEMASNDVAWYAADAALLRDSASIPFSWSTGLGVDMSNPVLPQRLVSPGIMAISLRPSVGYADNPNSPINIAAKAQYSFIRHANSGSSNYDAPDLMLYIMAMSQIYSYINYLQRLYGISTMYSQRNRYMPRALVVANGADFDDIVSSLADFRFGINALIRKAGSLATPSNMTIFNRQAFLYQYVYTEGTSVKDQMYMYVPNSFLKFENRESDDFAGSLRQKSFFSATSLRTVKQLLAYGNDLLDPLISSEDINIMSGDILKAYGDGGIMKLATIDVDPAFAPVFNVGVLEQMKNATLVGADIVGTDIVQSSSKSYLQSQPILKPTADAGTTFLQNCYLENRILTTTTADVDAGLVMENTRLMVGAHKINTYDIALDCGSELAINARFWFYDDQANLKSVVWNTFENFDNSTDPTLILELMDKLRVSASFRYAPCRHIFIRTNTTDTTPTASYFMYDFDNYAVITDNDLLRMHEAALLNQFHVPTVGIV